MARSLPSIPDGVNMQRLLDVLAQAGIVPSDEQAAHLNGLGGGYLVPVVTGVTISTPNSTISMPVIIDDSDSDDEVGVTISNESEAGSPTVANTHATTGPHTDKTANAVPTNNTADSISENEREDGELKPGTYLECKVCGSLFDLKYRKSGQPWHVVFVGRTVGIFRSFFRAKKEVDGVSHGFRRRYKTYEDAKSAFIEARKADKVRVRGSKKEMIAANDAAQAEYQREAGEMGAVATYGV